MGIVLRFRRRHARAGSSGAASVASSSTVTPFSRATSVETTLSHHSAGMLLRCDHFGTSQAPAPTSVAMALSEGQSLTTSRNEAGLVARSGAKSVIPRLLGQMVLKRKGNVSYDCGSRLGHNVRMADSETETQFKQRFTKRIKEARIALGWKQWQMAEALGMPQDKYKQYEGRSLLPHHLIGRFCLVSHVDPEWLVTGHGQKPLQPLKLATSEPAAPAKPKRTRARRAA